MNHQIIPSLLLSAAAQEKIQLPKAVYEQIRNSRAWVERAMQLFLCTTVSSTDQALHL